MTIPRGQTDERKAYMKEWCLAHPNRDRRAYKSAYDKENTDKIIAYRKRNIKRKRKQSAEWYLKNRDGILARVKKYTEVNRDRVLAYHAKYYLDHPDKVKAWAKAWRIANPEKKAHSENKRRARKAGNGGSHTLAQRLEKFAMLGNVCFYCGSSEKLTHDHDVPLSRGGTDDIENILPACRSCNSRKNNKTAQEFIQLNHQRMGGTGTTQPGETR